MRELEVGLEKQLAKGITRRSVLFGAVVAAGATAGAQKILAQDYRYEPEHRRPLDATMHDLQEIEERNTYSGKERERYDNALRHVSQFADRLQDGHFDKDKLDEAIGDVQHVIDNNRMGERAKRALLRDVAELRRLRENYDHGYRYRG